MEPTNKKRSVLVVDDDVDFLEQLRVQLDAAGFEVITAESGNDASRILDEKRPDVAVLDLMMENPDTGFTLAHRIKRLDPKIPVVVVTGVTAETGMMFDTATPGERSWVKADVVLAKPIRFEQLRREIDRLLGI